MRIYSIVSTLLFIAFAVVQYNDPDPFLWILVYSFFACLALSLLWSLKLKMLHLLSALAALIWMYFQWPVKWEGLGETMNNENVERGRESLGLLICAASALCNFWFCAKSKS